MLQVNIFKKEKYNNRIYLKCRLCSMLVRKHHQKHHRCYKKLHKQLPYPFEKIEDQKFKGRCKICGKTIWNTGWKRHQNLHRKRNEM